MFAFLLFGVYGVCQAQHVGPPPPKDPIEIHPIKNGQPRPKGDDWGNNMILLAEYNAEELTVSITDYWGDMDVLILGPWHTQMYSDSVAVSGSETLNIDISSYASGIYYIYILVDDEWYEGEFEIEL